MRWLNSLGKELDAMTLTELYRRRVSPAEVREEVLLAATLFFGAATAQHLDTWVIISEAEYARSLPGCLAQPEVIRILDAREQPRAARVLHAIAHILAPGTETEAPNAEGHGPRWQRVMLAASDRAHALGDCELERELRMDLISYSFDHLRRGMPTSAMLPDHAAYGSSCDPLEQILELGGNIAQSM